MIWRKILKYIRKRKLTWCVEDDDEELSFKEDAENEERPLLLFGESVKSKQSTIDITLHFHEIFQFKKSKPIVPNKGEASGGWSAWTRGCVVQAEAPEAEVKSSVPVESGEKKKSIYWFHEKFWNFDIAYPEMTLEYVSYSRKKY